MTTRISPICAILICLFCVAVNSYSTARYQHVTIQEETGLKGVVLLPEGTPPADGWPAVLLLHDHGARFEKGWRKVIGNNPEPYYSGMAIGDSLASHGYVVLCIDALYWGSRKSALSQRQFSDSLGTGQWFKRVLADDKACVDWLYQETSVNKHRIAVAGFSYGAFRAWNLAAEDERVSVCIASHWMTTLAQNRYNDSWLCMYRPGLYPLDKTEWIEQQYPTLQFAKVAAQIAPRPFLLEYGIKDKLFPVNGVDSCVQLIDSVYQAPIGKDNHRSSVFQHKSYNEGHIFTYLHLQNWLSFLQKQL